MTFNIGGVDLMLQAANLSEMAWFFHRERLPSANAWTMTLVATEACPGFQAEQVSMCMGNKMPTGMEQKRFQPQANTQYTNVNNTDKLVMLRVKEGNADDLGDVQGFQAVFQTSNI